MAAPGAPQIPPQAPHRRGVPQVILAEVSPRGSLRSLGDAEELGTAGEGAALYALQGPPAPPAGTGALLGLVGDNSPWALIGGR